MSTSSSLLLVQFLSLLTTSAFLSLPLAFSCLPPSFFPSCHLSTYHPNPQIKRFLEDKDDAELNKFVKDFPGSESCHQPEAKTWASRPQILEPRPQAPDLCQDDLEFRTPSWPQPSDSQQYFSASAPLSPSARPRSPWGKLDPYDSSEVEPPAPPLSFSGLVQEDPGKEQREPECVCVYVHMCVCVADMRVRVELGPLSVLCWPQLCGVGPQAHWKLTASAGAEAQLVAPDGASEESGTPSLRLGQRPRREGEGWCWVPGPLLPP